MKTSFSFPADFRTEVSVNQNHGITIRQITDDLNEPEVVITIGSKKRALEIARAIRCLSGLFDFTPNGQGS